MKLEFGFVRNNIKNPQKVNVMVFTHAKDAKEFGDEAVRQYSSLVDSGTPGIANIGGKQEMGDGSEFYLFAAPMVDVSQMSADDAFFAIEDGKNVISDLLASELSSGTERDKDKEKATAIMLAISWRYANQIANEELLKGCQDICAVGIVESIPNSDHYERFKEILAA